MSSIKTTQIDGDVSIGRNVAVGGTVTVQGSSQFKGNVKIEGWVDAKNIKGANKGLFTTLAKLQEAYPTPHDGWWAIVGTGLPGPIYVGDGGEWVATGEEGGDPTIDVEQYSEAVEELADDLESLATDVEANTTNITSLQTQVTTVATLVNTNSSSISSLGERMTQAESDIDSLEEQMTQAETNIDTVKESLEERLTVCETYVDNTSNRVVAFEERMTQAETDITALATTLGRTVLNLSTDGSYFFSLTSALASVTDTSGLGIVVIFLLAEESDSAVTTKWVAYQWKATEATDDNWNDLTLWEEFGSSSAVGNTYNATVEIPLATGEYYSDINATTQVYDVLAAVYAAGVASLGLQITFAIAANSWKSYQYVGVNTTEAQFTSPDNWIDLAGMSAGTEAVINVNSLCDDIDYTLSTAVSAIIALEESTGITYRKVGLVITYRRDADNNTWETKQYQGQLADMTATNEDQWVDFGGSGGSADIETTDDVENGSEALITSGGVYTAMQTSPIVNFNEESDADNYIFQGVNAKGEDVGDPITIPKSTTSGSSGSTLNIYPETQAVWAAYGSSITLACAIKSVSYDGDTEILGTIKTISILDATTKLVLWTETVNQSSSTSATNYSFTFDFTDFITEATSKDFIIQATDADGNTKTRTITVTAVDVTCTAVNALYYSTSYSLTIGGSTKSLPMYKFANNVSTKQGILVTTEMYYEGEWMTLGTAVVTDTYSHNISINPNDVFGNGEALSHGAYPIRIQGVDVASGVEGNIVYTAVMCIDSSSSEPVVALRYDDNNNGTVQLYDTLSFDIAAYTPGKTSTTVEVYFDGDVISTLSCISSQTYNVSKQIQGYASDGSKTIDVYATSGDAVSVTITVTVSGSAIDASMKDGALFGYDFSTRSNDETDHTIEDSGYEMTVEGSNYSSNGFVDVLGEQTLRIAENVTASIPWAPFSSTALETSGVAFQMAFSTKSIKDADAELCSCYDSSTGAGFRIYGNRIVLSVAGGTPTEQEVGFKTSEKITIAVVVEPGTKYVTYTSDESSSGTNYAFVKLYVNGEECAAIGYQPGNNALRQSQVITFDSESGDIAVNYILAYNSYMEWLEAFQNYLCKVSDVTAMITEYNKEDVLDSTGKPSMSMMDAKGIPYYVVVADQTTFDNFDYALNGGTSTSDQFACTLYYYNPSYPCLNFKAENTLWRRQGTTSAQRPIKNDRFNFNKKNKSTGLKATVTLLDPDDSTDLGQKAITAAAHNKVIVDPDGFAVDIITVKVDYSDSSNANDCGVCNMMNATFRALGSDYMTPAQRAFDGTQDLGDDDVLTDIQMDHSTKNHPIAGFRATSDTLQDAWFHAKGNWKEDKGEQVALGFKDTPGYNLGCINYGDDAFIEYFGTEDETLAQTEERFLEEEDLDTSSLYLISQYCGQDYAFYRYIDGAWTRSTGSMKQVDGEWVVTGDVLNPVTGYELLQYAGMDWWQGVGSVEDMMASSTQVSKWVSSLGLSATTYPAWTYYFECMVDDDQLQEDLALGKKVPYELFKVLEFLNSCDYSSVDGWEEIWQQNAFRYMSMESVMAYTAFTDYLAAVDQRAKNMQPMFFLEDGCSVEDGVYSGYKTMMPLRMYLNKVYDCDTCNGSDNDGGKSIDPEVDPNKATDEESGYTNPYMGSGSVLFNNIAQCPEVWNSNDDGGTTISLNSVVAKMRTQTASIDGSTIVPFSPDGANYFFVQSILEFWPKVVSSYDGERKYIDHTSIANMPYFYALHGLGLTSVPRFIEQRWAIRDGYYQTGDFFTNPLSGRVSAISDDSKIYITAAKTGYFGIGNDASGQLSETVYLEAGESYEFTTFAHDAGALLYIYQPGRLSKIDLSEMTLAFHFNDLSKLVLCEEIILGGDKHTADSSLNGFTSLSSLVLGDLPFLEYLDVSGTAVTSIDASGCPRIDTIIATDTALTKCTLAQTSPITTMALPDSMTSLELVNLPNLTYPDGGFTMEGASAITHLWIEGCPNIDTELLVQTIAESASVKEVRLPDLMLSGSVAALSSLMSSGAIGLDSSGTAYEESGQCSGVTGTWMSTDYLDDSTLSALQTYFPELTIYNAQYTMIEFDDTSEDPQNITNLDNGTTGSDYEASAHVLKIWEKLIPVVGKLNTAGTAWVGNRLSESDYSERADGDEDFDCTDSLGSGNDSMMRFPHCWYKGINDFKNQKKYHCWSSLDDEPLSTAANINRQTLSDIIYKSGAVLYPDYAVVGESTLEASGLINDASSYNVYLLDVSGMKQVRWPGVNSTSIGAVFLDEDGVVIQTYNMAISNSLFDFSEGDYIFIDVPDDAESFVFASLATNNDLEAIAVDSDEIEAIEPDWVENAPWLAGIYQASIDTLTQMRSISGATVQTGSGTSTTSADWVYDSDGKPTNTPTSLNYTAKDFQNLAARRGSGYQEIDYEMSKMLANLFFAMYGTRDAQLLCGYGKSSGGTTGYADSIGKSTTYLGQLTGNKILGIESLIGCTTEWMDNVAINVTTYAASLAAKMTSDDTTLPIDAVWHIYDPIEGTERTVQGITSSGYAIARVKNGRYCDVIASKASSDNSVFATYYCDYQNYSSSRCRAVLRSSNNANAHGGLVYAFAGHAFSGSITNSGSRLAFRGDIEIEDE